MHETVSLVIIEAMTIAVMIAIHLVMMAAVLLVMMTVHQRTIAVQTNLNLTTIKISSQICVQTPQIGQQILFLFMFQDLDYHQDKICQMIGI